MKYTDRQILTDQLRAKARYRRFLRKSNDEKKKELLRYEIPPNLQRLVDYEHISDFTLFVVYKAIWSPHLEDCDCPV